jgi:hypothetical protein
MEPQRPAEGLLLDLRRKSQLAVAGPSDHAGVAHTQPKTIFKTLDEELKPFVKGMLGKELFWSDHAVAEIEQNNNPENMPRTRLVGSPAIVKYTQLPCDAPCGLERCSTW